MCGCLFGYIYFIFERRCSTLEINCSSSILGGNPLLVGRNVLFHVNRFFYFYNLDQRDGEWNLPEFMAWFVIKEVFIFGTSLKLMHC